MRSLGGVKIGKGFPMLRSKRQDRLSAITYSAPVKPGYGFVCLINEEVNPPLYSFASRHRGIVISGRWFVHEYDSVASAHLKASHCAAPVRPVLPPGHRPSENHQYSPIVTPGRFIWPADSCVAKASEWSPPTQSAGNRFRHGPKPEHSDDAKGRPDPQNGEGDSPAHCICQH